MAGDSLAVSGDLTAGALIKKVWRYNGNVYGMTGQLNDLEVIKQWQLGGCEGEPEFSDDFSAMMLTKKGIFFFDKTLQYHKGANLWALGNGRELALGAMYAGASPTQAVRIACKLNVNTGGPVRTLWL
jgi:hypothetical protein